MTKEEDFKRVFEQLDAWQKAIIKAHLTPEAADLLNAPTALVHMDEGMSVGDIGNTYGGLFIKEVGGLCFWTIEDYSGKTWSEIPRYIYNDLFRYETNRRNMKV